MALESNIAKTRQLKRWQKILLFYITCKNKKRVILWLSSKRELNKRFVLNPKEPCKNFTRLSSLGTLTFSFSQDFFVRRGHFNSTKPSTRFIK